MTWKTHCPKCGKRMKRDDDMWRCIDKECNFTKAWRYVTKIQ